MAIMFVQAPQEFKSSFLKVMSERGFLHQITDAAGAHNPEYPFCKLPRHSTLLYGGFPRVLALDVKRILWFHCHKREKNTR